MKPFNFEAYEAGAEVVCRNTEFVVLAVTRADPGTEYPLVVTVKNVDSQEVFAAWLTNDGRYWDDKDAHQWDLFMASTKREGWVNIYPRNWGDGDRTTVDEDADQPRVSALIHPTREIADIDAGKSRITCVKIEWEE
jgi:hypothetical protein